MNDAEKLDWFELQLRLKTIEVMLGTKYREALGMTVSTLYDEQKLVAMSKRLGVKPESMLERLEKMRIDLGFDRATVEQGIKPAPAKPQVPPIKLKKVK